MESVLFGFCFKSWFRDYVGTLEIEERLQQQQLWPAGGSARRADAGLEAPPWIAKCWSAEVGEGLGPPRGPVPPQLR